MRTAGALILFALVISLAACAPEGDTSEPKSTTLATTSSQPASIAATAAPGAGPMVLEKRLGERASLGCPDNDTARCDVDFAINAIEPNQQCDDTYGSPIGPTQQLLRFDLEVWTAPQFAHDVDSALFLEHWGVGDAQGVDTNLQDHTAIRCNGELTGDQISKFLLPGAHFTKSIFVTAPQNATVLRLYLGNQGDGWTWPVPTA